MKHIIAFAGSNSKQSINKQLAAYAAGLVLDTEYTVLDLNDFEVPLYSVDAELENGLPDQAVRLVEMIKKADGLIISLAEHNGAYTAVFKNMFDWMSRIEPKTFQNKPMLLMATSPGARGGLSVLDMAKDRFPRHDAQIVSTFSLPSFYENFSEGKLSNPELEAQLLEDIKLFKTAL
ncbi:NADPH-dependent FMN reductase [Formosa algae]|uniref:NAD(P)H-dependent FMN reductase n=1 Tax=Formosa algae TaxID=225843 RepID=A0A9X0YM12_9FLAO|nr:NAD(P)H-dependent oxidoreductase [Formosa algae]MBP1841061.1 NAD(P)H-dependent FMN reductase [Formosa algae]MDQ0336519.1 NAD(P)H-dependent FMN reductase [Formosa algae]OEI81477.1 NADPH-dependent FMN reductase [Formosa algae]